MTQIHYTLESKAETLFTCQDLSTIRIGYFEALRNNQEVHIVETEDKTGKKRIIA